MKQKDATDDALIMLGYYKSYKGEFSAPALDVNSKIDLLYEHLGLTITKAGYKVIKRLPTRAKKEKK